MKAQLNLQDLNFSDRVNLQNIQISDSISSNSCVNTDESKPNNFFQMNTLSSNYSLSMTSSAQNNSYSNGLISNRTDMNKSKFCKDSLHQNRPKKETHTRHFRNSRNKGFVSEQSNQLPSVKISERPNASQRSNEINFTIYSNSNLPDLSNNKKTSFDKKGFNGKGEGKVRYEKEGHFSESDSRPELSHFSSQTNDFFKNNTMGMSKDSQAFFMTFNQQGSQGTKFVQSEFNHENNENVFGLGKEKVFLKSESRKDGKLKETKGELIDFNLSQEYTQNAFNSSRIKTCKKSPEIVGSLLKNCDKMSFSYSTVQEKEENEGSQSKKEEQFKGKTSSQVRMQKILEEPISPIKREDIPGFNVSPLELKGLSPRFEQKAKRRESGESGNSKQTLIYEDLPDFDSPDFKLKSQLKNKESPQSGSPCKKGRISRFRSNLNFSKKSEKEKNLRRSKNQFKMEEKENVNMRGENPKKEFTKLEKKTKKENHFVNLERPFPGNFQKKAENPNCEDLMKNASGLTKVNSPSYKLNLAEILEKRNKRWTVEEQKFVSQKFSDYSNLMKTLELNSEGEKQDVSRQTSKKSPNFESSETKNFRRSEKKSLKYRYQRGGIKGPSREGNSLASVFSAKKEDFLGMTSNSKKRLFAKKENKDTVMNFEIVNTTQSKFKKKNLAPFSESLLSKQSGKLASQFNSKKLAQQLNKNKQISKQNLSQKELITNLRSFNNVIRSPKSNQKGKSKKAQVWVQST